MSLLISLFILLIYLFIYIFYLKSGRHSSRHHHLADIEVDGSVHNVDGEAGGGLVRVPQIPLDEKLEGQLTVRHFAH
jgi:hypothetical protein